VNQTRTQSSIADVLRPTADEIYLNRSEAATYCRERGLPVAPTTLAKLACIGGGPRFFRFGGRRVLYRVADLSEWILTRSAPLTRSTTTAEVAQ
jgi:hypothetical protein